MDDQKWDLTWDDEDIVEDFSEILRKEKNILRLVKYQYQLVACKVNKQ